MWCKGRGRRSKARIGRKSRPKLKSSVICMQPAPAEDLDIPASHWSEHLDVPEEWIDISVEEELRLCKISRQDCSGCSPLAVSRSLIVNKQNDSWVLHINGHRVNPASIPSLSDFTSHLNSNSMTMLLQTVHSLNICVGNPELMFVQLGMSKKNQQFLAPNKEVVGYVDTGFIVTVEAQQYSNTVRSSGCHLLTEGNRCCECTKYRHNLSAMCSRVVKRNNSTVKKN